MADLHSHHLEPAANVSLEVISQMEPVCTCIPQPVQSPACYSLDVYCGLLLNECKAGCDLF